MSDGYWTNQRIDALVYADHERNHHPPDPECWYCQNERAEAMADNQTDADAGAFDSAPGYG
jgi:hypothetical protein